MTQTALPTRTHGAPAPAGARRFAFTTTGPRSPVSTWLGWLLILAGMTVPLTRGAHLARDFSRDFANIYAGGACLLQHCPPYDTTSLEAVLERNGFFKAADNWSYTLPIYPPTTLALATPLTVLRFANAATAFFTISFVALFAACWLVFVRSPSMAGTAPALRGLLFALVLSAPKTSSAFAYGNPVVLTVALLMLCCFDTSERRRWLRVALFCVACILKPQLALPAAAVLLLKPQDGWVALRRIAAVLAVYTGAVLLWCSLYPSSRHWLPALRHTLALGAAGSMNPGFRVWVFDTLLNLEYMLGYWIAAPHARLLVTGVLLLCLFGATAIACVRMLRSPALQASRLLLLLLAGTVAAITLLPVYHRFYDGMILFLAWPFAFAGLRERAFRAEAGAALLLLAACYFTWVRHLPGRLLVYLQNVPDTNVFGFLARRAESIEVFLLSVLLVCTLWRHTRNAADAV